MNKIQKLLSNKLFKQALDAAEQEIFLAAYSEAGCNESLTAKLLGLSRGTIRERLKRWNVTKLPKRTI